MVQHTKHIVWTIALFAISTKTISFTENKIYLFFFTASQQMSKQENKESLLASTGAKSNV